MTHLTAENLLPLLQGMQKTTDKLYAIHQREADILGTQDSERLIDCTQDKNTCLQQLETEEQQRMQLMQQAGLDSSPAVMSQCLAEIADNQNCLELWQSVQTQIQNCQHLNQRNGELIQQRAQQLHQAVDIMFAPPEKNSYSGEIVKESPYSGKLLGSA